MQARLRHDAPWTGAIIAALVLLTTSGLPGCGTGAEDGGGAVVTLGPSPIGGDDSPSGGGDGGNDNSEEPVSNDNASTNDNGGDDLDGDPGGGQENDNAGDGTEGGTDFADACEAVAGRTFVNGNLSIAFTLTLFSWVTSDGLVTGAYTCNRFNLLGIAPDEGQFVGAYDAATDSISWQGLSYVPAG